jgi:RNA polymerase sigma factor (sigma-70 family)
MSGSFETCALAERWRGGDQEAARQLFDLYVRRLVGLARGRINPLLAARVDPEDVVQSAFHSFFRRLRNGEFQLDEADGLWHLLVRITVCKTLRQIEFHRASKRDPGRESLGGDGAEDRWADLLSREPSPADALALRDELDHFLRRLDPVARQIVEMRLSGQTAEEISQCLGMNNRKVRRVLERIVLRAEGEAANTQ